MSYGLYLISSVADGKASGCVVNTLAQVTSKPAKVSIAISHNFVNEKIFSVSSIISPFKLPSIM